MYIYFADTIACEIVRTPNIIISVLMIAIGGTGFVVSLLMYGKLKREVQSFNKDFSLKQRASILATIFIHEPINSVRVPLLVICTFFLCLVTLLGGIALLVISILGIC